MHDSERKIVLEVPPAREFIPGVFEFAHAVGLRLLHTYSVVLTLFFGFLPSFQTPYK